MLQDLSDGTLITLLLDLRFASVATGLILI